jgi:hypothetical protein
MNKNSRLELAEIIDSLKKAVDGGDLGKNLDAAAQRLKEDGLLEIVWQQDKEVVWKLTPQGIITAQLEELIGIKRLERLHNLADSEGEENEYEQLLQEIMNDLAPIFVWFAENGFLEVRD